MSLRSSECTRSTPNGKRLPGTSLFWAVFVGTWHVEQSYLLSAVPVTLADWPMRERWHGEIAG